MPTSSHAFVPSWLALVTSKQDSGFFLHASVLWKDKDFILFNYSYLIITDVIYIYIYIYILYYIYFCIKIVINTNCIGIDNLFLLNKKDSQGVMSYI